MILAMLMSTLGITVISAVYLVLRNVGRTSEMAFRSVVMSPANEAMTGDHMRARVGAVLALDAEMLVELRPADRSRDSDANALWLHSSPNVGAMITLAQWRDADAVVDLRHQQYGTFLWSDETRICLQRAQVDLSL
jgi:hypothetical protein